MHKDPVGVGVADLLLLAVFFFSVFGSLIRIRSALFNGYQWNMKTKLNPCLKKNRKTKGQTPALYLLSPD